MLIPELTLRAARIGDYDFALALYLESVKPLLLALGRWDEERMLSRFSDGFKLEQIKVLRRAGGDIGWMQVSETEQEVHLDQLHLIDGARNQKIGTHLIRRLQERARAAGKPLALNVIRGNPAKALYERLGFRTDGGDEEKIRMLWSGEPVATI
jgi:ribosomal protein S18 acetylase RimI-like enzyme